MDVPLDILRGVLAVLMAIAAWCWLRFGQEPSEGRRVAAAYVTACVFGYGALLAAYQAFVTP